jgi:hypothetical protein
MALKAKREKTKGIVIVDPYFMRDVALANKGDRATVKEYLGNIPWEYLRGGPDHRLHSSALLSRVSEHHHENFFLRISGWSSYNNLFSIVLRRGIYCSLISICPRWSQATYFDSSSDTKPMKNYGRIKSVLDDALQFYAKRGANSPRVARESRMASMSSCTTQSFHASSSHLAV